VTEHTTNSETGVTGGSREPPSPGITYKEALGSLLARIYTVKRLPGAS